MEPIGNNIEIDVYNLLKTVLDPELEINIIDLGLVYEIEYTEEKGIRVSYTLTSPGCPLGEVISKNIREVLEAKFQNISINIECVWEPAWSHDLITNNGRALLGE